MSAIENKYNQLGGAGGILGAPKGPEAQCTDPKLRKRDYINGSIYFYSQNAQSVPFEIHGNIAAKFYSLNAENGLLTYPISDETAIPGSAGRVSHFNGGDIYWSPSTGAFEVHGGILGRYASIGGPQSVLGFPLTDEAATSDNSGRFNQFQLGVLYWKSSAGAHEVHGAILAKWQSLNAQAGSLGYPLTNEVPVATPAGGRQNRFEHGTILWTAATGATVL